MWVSKQSRRQQLQARNSSLCTKNDVKALQNDNFGFYFQAKWIIFLVYQLTETNLHILRVIISLFKFDWHLLLS